MTIIWRTALILLVLFAGWRALALGVGAHYAQQVDSGGTGTPQAALAWDPGSRAALAQVGSAQRGSGGDAQAAWSRLLRQDPTNAKALLGLAQVATDPVHGDALVESATRLNPASPAVLKEAALHWLNREAPERALAAWSAAMVADRGERAGLYPVLFKLYENPSSRGLFAPYAAQPPDWWDGFFRHVARNAADTELVRALFALRRDPAAAPVSTAERDVYVERLRKDGLTTEAYLTWVNGLDDGQRQLLGLINNGSFESEPTNTGWDWRIRSTKHLLVETAQTYGTDRARALHLVFRGFDEGSIPVSQDLFLEPGGYRLRGRVRPQGLKTTGGLQWVVYCVQAQGHTRLAETQRLLGSSQWEDFELEFEIPTDCQRPILRLDAAVRVLSDRRMDGSIWFDALRIQRLPRPVTATETPGEAATPVMPTPAPNTTPAAG